jgi:DNA-binding CsgD family transcriptional regulator
MFDSLQHGRECYERCAWAEAYATLSHADAAAPLNASDLQRLATSAYLIGRDSEFQQLNERLHRTYVEADDRAGAARSCFWLALSMMLRGEVGQSNAWIARGQRLLGEVDCVEVGYLLGTIAEQQLRAEQLDAALASATESHAIGERFADVDLISMARHMQGRALIQQGHIRTGLGRLDEAMLCVVAGEVSVIMTGLLYCSVLLACREVYALGRAQEWTAAFTRMCQQRPEMIAFTDACVVHRAEIMQFRGAWPDALAEASRVCERYELSDRSPPAAALYQQAEIHRLRGEFAKADEAYRAASERGREPQPGLALLRLAQGRVDSARAALNRLMSATSDRLRRASLLPVQLEVTLADSDIEAARSARDELQELSEILDSDMLRAVAAQAHGAVALAENDARAALDPLRRAFAGWHRLGAPYEAARARVLVGQVCRALGDEEAARLELAAAKRVFERLGAKPDLARVAALAARTAPGGDQLLTPRELDVLRLISSGHTNKAIAARLCLSERTIDRHVSNMLRKLGVPSRAAATAYAYDRKLL